MYSNYGNYSSRSNGCACNGALGFTLFLIFFILVIIWISFGILAKCEAKKQGRNEIAWFFLGVLFSLNAFFALKVSKAADEEGHSMNLWSTLGIIFGVRAILAFEAGLNAENKQHDFDCWVIVGFMSGLFAVLVSCFLKPFEKSTIRVSNTAPTRVANTTPTEEPKTDWVCENCGTKNSALKIYCTKCARIRPRK
jgi:hypothetical protein